MNFPKIPDFKQVLSEIEALAALKSEYGSEDPTAILQESHSVLCQLRHRIADIPVDALQEAKEPNDLQSIKELRSPGPRRIWSTFDPEKYRQRLTGSVLARSAGCTLGAIVEGWPIEKMEKWAKETAHSFPPRDYWPEAVSPSEKRYGVSRCDAYTRDRIDGVPVDDDLAYTQLGLLLLEKYGVAFTTDQVGSMWNEYLNWVWTDMKWPLDRFRAGVAARNAADGNPWQQMICAFIRCDPYGYVAAGWPELAAELSWRDGLMSHRRNGLYGGMFFAAAIAAAFTADHPVEALKIGLSEIPSESRLAKDVRWALDIGKGIKDYRDARSAVDGRFSGMHPVHTINNACLVVFGLMIGGTDVTRVISETVAMGLDNDCTAATAGSIVGAIVGEELIPEHWHRRFNNRMHSYIKDHPVFHISDIIDRYARQAERIWV